MVVIGQMGVDRQGRGDFGVTHETRKLQRRNPGGDTQTGVVQWSSRYSERSSRRTAPARIDTDQNFEAIDRRVARRSRSTPETSAANVNFANVPDVNVQTATF